MDVPLNTYWDHLVIHVVDIYHSRVRFLMWKGTERIWHLDKWE